MRSIWSPSILMCLVARVALYAVLSTNTSQSNVSIASRRSFSSVNNLVDVPGGIRPNDSSTDKKYDKVLNTSKFVRLYSEWRPHIGSSLDQKWNLVFVKLQKCSSSTAGGVIRVSCVARFTMVNDWCLLGTTQNSTPTHLHKQRCNIILCNRALVTDETFQDTTLSDCFPT